jgi:hypothetical protein
MFYAIFKGNTFIILDNILANKYLKPKNVVKINPMIFIIIPVVIISIIFYNFVY